MVSAPTGASDVALTVKSGATAVEPGTATVPVRVGFVRSISIPVGTPVQIDIAAQEHRDVVIVPTTAVVREGDEAAVFVVSDGKADRCGSRSDSLTRRTSKSCRGLPRVIR